MVMVQNDHQTRMAFDLQISIRASGISSCRLWTLRSASVSFRSTRWSSPLACTWCLGQHGTSWDNWVSTEGKPRAIGNINKHPKLEFVWKVCPKHPNTLDENMNMFSNTRTRNTGKYALAARPHRSFANVGLATALLLIWLVVKWNYCSDWEDWSEERHARC